ncbi:MAG: DUF2914 domain-containing protein [Flavobacteriales bacterium]|nr:DUF2914 domain-containing protein [Flavobacteriales bacterium]
MINYASREALDQLYDILDEASNVNVEISGHTCDIGEAAYNYMLSTSRAQAVVAYLVQKGIPKDRLQAKGYGGAKPFADNETVQGRKLNRRTELTIVDVIDKPAEVDESLAGVSSPKDDGAVDVKKPKEGHLKGAAIKIVGTTVCESVKDRIPIGAGATFSKDVGRLYFFTNILSAVGQEGTVTHIWYYDNKKMAAVTLDYKGPRWRTFSSKHIMTSWTGEWRAEAVSEGGAVLKSVTFTVK